MKITGQFLFYVLFISLLTACNGHNDSIKLGNLETGATVSFVNDTTGEWGLAISGNDFPNLSQNNPVIIEIFEGEENVNQLTSGYKSVQKNKNTIEAKATVNNKGKSSFEVEDRWSISGNVLSLTRKVTVSGTLDSAGFYSAIRLTTEPSVKWEDAEYMIPGLLYSDPTYGGGNTPGGSMNYNAKRLSIREDILSAPLFSLTFKDGNHVAVLDPEPDGRTIAAEVTTPATAPLIDERIKYGALGARELPGNGVEFGFWLPGTTDEFSGSGESATSIVRRRYNPVIDGFTQEYKVEFLFGKSESFLSMEQDVWRWAWDRLKPEVAPLDMDTVRRVLLDHLADHVLVAGDLAGVPFLYDAVTGNPGSYRYGTTGRRISSKNTRPANVPLTRHELSPEDSRKLAEWAASLDIYLDPYANELKLWPRVVMGFVSKGIESAEQLVYESYRDQGPRGQKMRDLGLMIINSFIKTVPMSPPAGEGFTLLTEEPATGSGGEGVVTLRAPSEGIRTLIDIYRREKQRGNEHPEWLNWGREFADWLLKQQREDGSFPRSWNAGEGTVKEESGTASYNPIPMLVKLTDETGDERYLSAAVRAADYVWTAFGERGIFIGGASDNPNITDKEAGMLSLEAFLILYEKTSDEKWLERAVAAANYAETWIWIWNVPMPADAIDSTLYWKKGVPTTGVQGITALAYGAVDQYMAWSVPAYAKLYKYTNDKHYLDVAYILLHGTKTMLALPGRTYDLLGPGWQQEHWSMGPRRGYGGHRSWLPWVSVNHLRGITGLEEFDPDLYRQLIDRQLIE